MNKDYDLLLQQARGLLSTEQNALANAANLTSLLYFNLSQVNWLGFYFLNNGQLVLGPFHGQPACTRIEVGKGVCGTAFATRQTLVVDDVHQFDGHIACDVNSESEIVVPFESKRVPQLKGVLDVDSPVLARFGDEERELFEGIVGIYLQATRE